MAVVTTPAILLRSHPYSETSTILRFFTAELGIVGVMAKGARKRQGKGGGGLSTFAGGDLTVYVKESRGLQTLKEFAPRELRSGLGASVVRFGAASVIAEIVLRQGGEAGVPGLYAEVAGALDRLAEVPEERVLEALLARGWGLVAALGFHPVLDVCVGCGRPLDDADPDGDAVGRFDFDAGGVRCPSCLEPGGGSGGPRIGPVARRQLLGLLEGREEPVRRPRAHLRLLSDFVTYHLSGARPLESFRFLTGVLPTRPDQDRAGTAAGVGELEDPS